MISSATLPISVSLRSCPPTLALHGTEGRKAVRVSGGHRPARQATVPRTGPHLEPRLGMLALVFAACVLGPADVAAWRA